MGFVEYVEIICGAAVVGYVVFFAVSAGFFEKND